MVTPGYFTTSIAVVAGLCIAIGIVALVVVLGGAYAYIELVRDDAPEKLTFSDHCTKVKKRLPLFKNIVLTFLTRPQFVL